MVKTLGVFAVTIWMVFAVLPVAMAQEDPDLIIYFDFEAIDNGVIHDQSGYGHDGVINGNITLVENGKRGKAAKFETGSFIDMDGPNFPKEHIPTKAMTVAAWVKCENTGGHHAIFNARASDATWIVHPELRSEGNFRWLLRANGGATIFDIRAGVVKWDTWLHYAGTYDSKQGVAILYIDGKEVGRQTNLGATIAEDWGMGARVGYNIDNARPFTGLMDDLTIYRRALSQEEILSQMEGGPVAFQAVSPKGLLTLTWGKLKVVR